MWFGIKSSLPFSEWTRPSDLDPSSLVDTSRASVSGLRPSALRVGLLGGFLSLFLIWIGYDGWLDQELEIAQHNIFNQIMTFVTQALVLPLVDLLRRIHRSVSDRVSTKFALLFVSSDGRELRVATAPFFWSVVFRDLDILPHRQVGVGDVTPS